MGGIAHDVEAQDDGDIATALRIAGELIDAGVPVFAAPPCPGASCTRPGHGSGGVEYDLPAKWQMTVPSRVWLERWQPGWALAAVGGWAADFLDEDPRNGGAASVQKLMDTNAWPRVYGVQETVSGGNHYLISPSGRRKVVGLLPGLDYQGGAPDGKGRGFVWIAPTVRRSKTDGELRAYRWAAEPDLDWLAEWGSQDGISSDESLDGLRELLDSWEAGRGRAVQGERALAGAESRPFTVEQMQAYCLAPIERLQAARVGEIEEAANGLACALSHFVPQMVSEDAAYDVLLSALGETAYDPSHPASTWEAEKFRAVLANERGRAPGDWYAVPAVETLEQAAAKVDEAVAAGDDPVAALLAEMLAPSVLRDRKPPRYMIKGLLSYDSEAWLIGGPGSKKSFVALDMAAHVALGRDWQGHKVNKGVALLIMGEGAGSVGKRITAWEKQYGPMPDSGLRILPRPVQAKDPQAWMVLVRACQRLRAALDAEDPSLGMFVVVDTQARSTVGLDENSAEEMGVYVNALAALREATGGCVLSVHHTTKSGSSTRGSGAQDGAQYSRLLMKSEPRTLTGQLITDKQKDMEEEPAVELRFHKVDVGVDEDGEPIDSLVLTPHDAWTAGGVDGQSLAGLEREALGEVTPFLVRSEPEEWTHRLTHINAKLQRWLLQALKDTAVERGLTQAEWRRVVEEKIGKQVASNWARAFQTVTDSMGRCGQVVVKIQGADRWTVDPMSIDGEN